MAAHDGETHDLVQIHALRDEGKLRSALPFGHRGTTLSATASHLLYNVSDTCVLMPTVAGKPGPAEPTTFQFKELVVCHDLLFAGARNTDLAAIVALASGEVLQWSPLTRKPSYVPSVKEGAADCSPVTLIRWCPATDGAFITGHANGQLLLYDRTQRRDTHSFGPPTPTDGKVSGGRQRIRSASMSASLRATSITAERPSSATTRQTPTSSWQAGTSGAAVTALSFTTDGHLLAIGLSDGTLSLFDFKGAHAPPYRLWPLPSIPPLATWHATLSL